MIKFNAQDRPIKEILFGHDQFRIPEYQRPYSWGVDEATDFRNDLTDADNGYFLGSFVFNYEDEVSSKRIDIIDGQQRSLTITIFLSVIRNILKKSGHQDLSNQVQDDYIAKYNAFKKTRNYRIICGESTRTFFEKYIQDGNEIIESILDKNSLKKEEKQIYEVYYFFKSKIENNISKLEGEKVIEKLEDYIDKIMDLRAIWIKIENETDAYTIFETVNARGVDLSVSDLVKNLIFKHYDKTLNKLDEAKKIRNEIEGNIIEANSDISKFLRHYRLSKYKYISEKDLFKEIKKSVKNYEEFLIEISEQSYYYKIILNSKFFDENDLELLTVEGKERDPFHIFQAMKGINILKIRQFAPIFLSIFRNYNKLVKFAGPKNIIENMEKFGYVYFGICNLPARTMEREGSNVAINIEHICNGDFPEKEISQKTQTIYNKYKEFLKSHYPSLGEFTHNFEELSYRKSSLVKYTLVKISNYIEKDNTGDDIFDYDKKINIEHIMPRDPKQWGLEKKEVVNYIDKIGNLTLLGRKMNSSIGNSKLENKVENEKGLKASPIKMTQILVEYFRKNNYIWGETEIKNRQNEICNQIFNIQTIN